MTVAELISHLQTFPQETECFCLEEIERGHSVFTRFKKLSYDDINFNDLRNNPFVKQDSPHFGKIFLQIGSK